MKAKYKKIIAFSLAAAVIAAVSAYTWLPGTKTVARQGVKATKAAAAHYLSTDAVDASNIRQVITADSTTSRTFMAVGLRRRESCRRIPPSRRRRFPHAAPRFQ